MPPVLTIPMADADSAPHAWLGVPVLLVDALHEKAARFYRAHGFREAMANSHTPYLPLGEQMTMSASQPIGLPAGGAEQLVFCSS